MKVHPTPENTIEDRHGGVLYEDVSDMPLRARLRLAELHSNRPGLTWEQAWDMLIDEGLLPRQQAELAQP